MKTLDGLLPLHPTACRNQPLRDIDVCFLSFTRLPSCLMDGDTWFSLANHVSQGRTVTDSREAFQEAKKVAKTEPSALLTDGLESYEGASHKAFLEAIHISGIGIQGLVNNNRMERYHGTFKERNKVMRAIKKPDSAILDGQRIYYNFVRPRQALNGKTPAEAAGIDQNLN